MRKIVGYGILISLFIGVFIFACIVIGVKFAVISYLSAFALVAIVGLAVYLINHSDN